MEERKRGGKRSSNFSLRSTKFHRLEFVEPRVKVHLLDEGYVWVPKRKSFTEDSNEEISRNKGSQAKEASYPCYYAPIGRDSFYFDLFSTLRVIWLCFMS